MLWVRINAKYCRARRVLNYRSRFQEGVIAAKTDTKISIGRVLVLYVDLLLYLDIEPRLLLQLLFDVVCHLFIFFLDLVQHLLISFAHLDDLLIVRQRLIHRQVLQPFIILVDNLGLCHHAVESNHAVKPLRFDYNEHVFDCVRNVSRHFVFSSKQIYYNDYTQIQY